MIVDVFLYGLYGFLGFVLTPISSLAPVALDSGIGAALTQIGGAIAVLDVVVPVATLIYVVVGVHLVVEGYIFGYKLIKWVYSKIPGIN